MVQPRVRERRRLGVKRDTATATAPRPALSYPILPFPALPCPTLRCPALSCPALVCPSPPLHSPSLAITSLRRASVPLEVFQSRQDMNEARLQAPFQSKPSHLYYYVPPVCPPGVGPSVLLPTASSLPRRGNRSLLHILRLTEHISIAAEHEHHCEKKLVNLRQSTGKLVSDLQS